MVVPRYPQFDESARPFILIAPSKHMVLQDPIGRSSMATGVSGNGMLAMLD